MKKWALKKYSGEKDLVQCLLKDRKIKPDNAEKFFNPDYESGLGDPFGILNMDRATSRILKAVKNSENVVVFGDYDADGICGTVIFHDFFKKINFENFDVYIPDRYEEGYGLTFKIVDEFIAKKKDLIIVIDCGITDFKEVKRAKEAGIDVIIIDHHLPPPELPPAYAIIDVYQKEDKYPFKNFSGAGMAFKTVSAVLKKNRFQTEDGWEKRLLDVVGIAVIADMVSLSGENRVLAHHGLGFLKKTLRLGLKFLFEKLKINPHHISEDDVGFLIAPRINSASRMDHATTSFLLLTTASESEAEWLCGRLEEKNNERRKLVGLILERIRGGADFKNENLIFFGDDSWPPGVLGLAANRILDECQKPVFLWGKDSKGLVKFSSRSNSIDLVGLMNSVPRDIFIDFGGHKFSAGATIEAKNLARLETELYNVLAKMPEIKQEEEILLIDRKMNLEDINEDNYKVIEKFMPFGMDNPKPVFWFSDLKVGSIRTFGNGSPHLGLTFKKSGGETIKAIGFFMASQIRLSDSLKAGNAIDLAASLDKNYYNGNIELRLRIVDFRVV